MKKNWFEHSKKTLQLEISFPEIINNKKESMVLTITPCDGQR